MKLSDFIKTLAAADIKLVLEDGALSVKAARGVITPPILAQLKERKDELTSFLAKAERKTPPITRTSRDQALELSYAQRRLWLLDRISGGSSHYNIPGALKLLGSLRYDALNYAFSGIISRHESLRTCFRMGDEGQAFQAIQPPTPLSIAVTDFSALSVDDRERRLNSVMVEEASRIFDLSTDLMLRARLIKLAADEHLLLVTLHHIAADGWSMPVLIREVGALYSAYLNGDESVLQPLDIQYADYANWQRKWLEGAALAKLLSYWTEQLANLPTEHSLPLDYPRPQAQTFNGHTYRSNMGSATLSALGKLCQRTGSTLFMGLHACFAVLLARYSNETDIVIGTPTANREQEEIAGLIGFFVNSLVLRSDLSGSPTFTELLQQSKRRLLDAYAHQQVPFEKIVEVLQPERSSSHSPLFQVMLSLQNNEEGVLELPGLKLEMMDQAINVAKYDLTLNATESEQGLQLDWQYNTDLFCSATIENMARHFELLVEALLARPDENVFRANMLNSDERHRLIHEWNDNAEQYPQKICLHELFEAQAEAFPDATALICDGENLSYGELDRRSNQLAHYLVSQKQVGVGDFVGVCLERSFETAIAVLAVLKAGGCYVPLDPNYPRARLAYMLEDARLRTVITQKLLCSSLPSSGFEALCLDDALLKEILKGQPCLKIPAQQIALQSHDLAYVIYTSGSTGNPKGVMVSHLNVVGVLSGLAKKFAVGKEDSFAFMASVAFDIAIFELFLTLISGGKSVIVGRETVLNPTRLAYELRECTLLHAVPSLMAEIEKYKCANPQDFSQVRKVFVGGDRVPRVLIRSLHYSFPHADVVELYGPTEATILTTSSSVSEKVLAHSGAIIGRGLANTELYVLSNYGAECPIGVSGELHIGGVGVTRGYLNSPDLTKSKFISNPFYDSSDPNSSELLYKSGDKVRWLSSGDLEFLGRVDHQVKVRGFRIELGEVEAALTSHPAVGEVVVLAQTVVNDPCLVAYVVPATGSEGKIEDADSRSLFAEDLRHHLGQRLPDYMVPAFFVLLDALPLTPNGKIDRKALPMPDLSDAQGSYIAPVTETEIALCDLWREALGAERIGIDDNFFKLGGHSLLAMKLLSKMNTTFGVNMEIRNLFEMQNVRRIAQFVDCEIKKIKVVDEDGFVREGETEWTV